MHLMLKDFILFDAREDMHDLLFCFFVLFFLVMILGLERSHCPNKVVYKFLCDRFGKIATLAFLFRCIGFFIIGKDF